MEYLDLRKAKLATKAIFLVCGFAISSWAPMIPFVKDNLGLDEASIGILLLFLGAGALFTMPLAGWAMTRLGSRKVIGISAFIIVVSLPLLLFMQSFATTAFMLFIFGAGIGGIDVSMNNHGVLVQNREGKSIMSSLHGLFSVGGLLGPLLTGVLIKMGLSPLVAAGLISVLIVLVVGMQYKYLIPGSVEIDSHKHVEKEVRYSGTSKLNGTIFFLGFLCFSVFLSEGAMLDWSAIFLRDNKGMEEAFAGVGYACFSVAMAFMRLTGDALVSKMGSRAIVIGGSILGGLGILLIILAPWIGLSLVGFVLLGLGAANIVPVFFSEGGRLNNAMAIPAITTMGYAGQLAGPALLGFIAQKSSLEIAFGFTALLLFVVAISYIIRSRYA